jgi:short-subunit dehydrogenase
MRRKLRDAVVVITGASSGIGRATALKFAERGATVVVAARREPLLQSLADECQQRGGRALAVRTDVTEKEQVEALARRAVETFGRIDVWVNNAAVTLFSRFEESPIEDYERVIRTNLFGYIYGARAVLPYFREQGEGVLINNASIVGVISQPYTSAYSLTKWAIRGLTESLRMELLDAPNIYACTVLPATIDTPFFQHAANRTGREVRAMEPVYPADMVADAIVHLSRHPRREVIVGGAGRMLAFQHAMAPRLAERMMARQVEALHLGRAPAAPSRGNLFEPMNEGTGVSGGWQERAMMTGGRRSRALFGLAALSLPVGLYLAQRGSRLTIGRRSTPAGRLRNLPLVRSIPGLRPQPRRGLLSAFSRNPVRRARGTGLRLLGWRR